MGLGLAVLWLNLDTTEVMVIMEVMAMLLQQLELPLPFEVMAHQQPLDLLLPMAMLPVELMLLTLLELSMLLREKQMLNLDMPMLPHLFILELTPMPLQQQEQPLLFEVMAHLQPLDLLLPMAMLLVDLMLLTLLELSMWLKRESKIFEKNIIYSA